MANPWFRLYSEFSDDPKVQMMSEAMQRRLIMLFCSRCKGETLHETELAFHWRVTETELAETKRVFVQKGFIDEGWNLLNWNRRQFLSDSSTERVRRYRQAMKQDETLQKHPATESVTPPEQNRTETEQKQSESKPRSVDPTPASEEDLEGTGFSLELYSSYMEVRKAKKWSFVDVKTRNRWIAKFRKFYGEGKDTADMLEQMIEGRWQGPVTDKWRQRTVQPIVFKSFDDPEYLEYRAKQVADAT